MSTESTGFVVVEKSRRVTRLYYAYDKDGHPFFGGPFAAATFADASEAERIAEKCAQYTGKEFQVLERTGEKGVEA